MDEKLINTNEEANKAKETAISPDVAFSNQQPVKLPNKPKQNASLSFEPFIASAQQNIDQATKTRDEGMSNIKEISDLLGNQGNRQIQMEEQSGVKALREDVTRLDSLISSKTQQYRTELQNLEGQNVASSFISGQQNRLNILATRELANLSIIRDSQSGRLEDAQAWVKAKVDAETAQLKSKLEFQQFVYQENKEILNKEQDKKFSLQIKETEQAYADEKEKQEKIQNMSLTAAQYGASPEALDQISGATSFEDALNKAGKYLGSEFRLKVDMQEFNKRMAQASLSLQREQFNFQKGKAEAEARASGGLSGKEDFSAAGFAKRMTDSKKYIDAFEKTMVKQGSKLPTVAQIVDFRANGKLPNEFQGEGWRRYMQAQEDFATANLREESGAQISDDEFIREASKYFAKPGDGAEVLAQKKQSRDTTTEALKLVSKGGYEYLEYTMSQPIARANMILSSYNEPEDTPTDNLSLAHKELSKL